MNKDEARKILRSELEKYRGRSYDSFRTLIAELDAYEVQSPSGTSYQVEIQAFWDGKPNSNIRVIGGIDDGGVSAFRPLTESFIVTPDGDVVDD
ncbi:MAG: hypothetical protein KDD69_15445 [Bdellovibrionales bacterium]|nr:hypothetical protein [Bdellovibrionales bacterium]